MIDVSKCIHYGKEHKSCYAEDLRDEVMHYTVYCCENDNCYYKQLQQALEENEKLRLLLLEDGKTLTRLSKENHINKQKLEKIKEIVKTACEDSVCHKNCEICSDGQILKIIEEQE